MNEDMEQFEAPKENEISELQGENGNLEVEWKPEDIENPKKKKKSKGNFFAGLVTGIILGALVCISTLLIIGVRTTSSTVSNDSADEIISDITGDSDGLSSNSKLAYLISIIKTYYYQDVDDETLVEGMYYGLLESLDDPYSAYYNAEEYEDLMTTLTGDYAGIGALLSKDKTTGVVTISKVYSDTPAEKAGLQAGDQIVSAAGVDATSVDLDEFVTNIRGEAGTDVELVIIRDDEEITVTATRDYVSTPTVEYSMLDNNIGYISISQFTNSTYDDFVAAYEDLEAQGMESVIFDLRNNGGGLLDSVVSILDYLLPEGTVVYTEDKYGNRQDYTSEGDTYKSIPMTVLVNEYTASASEIFTGAIRDFDYGTIIGTNTFGKGIVQSTIPLSDGSAIKLTTESYYTPSGECIHGTGIAPDIELEYEFLGGEDDTYSYDLDNQIQKAIEVLLGEAE